MKNFRRIAVFLLLLFSFGLLFVVSITLLNYLKEKHSKIADIPFQSQISISFTTSKPSVPHQFGTTEYSCQGTCYCNEDDRRNSLSKGLLIAVSAVSAITAVDSARGYFEEKCKTVYSANCEIGNIYSDVQDCSVTDAEVLQVDEKEHFEMEFGEKGDHDTTKHFKCLGHCIPNKRMERDHFDSRLFHPSSVLQLRCEGFKVDGILSQSYSSSDVDLGNMPKVEDIFLVDVLNDVCRAKSEMQPTKQHGQDFIGPLIDRLGKEGASMKRKNYPDSAIKRMISEKLNQVYGRCIGGNPNVEKPPPNIDCWELDDETYKLESKQRTRERERGDFEKGGGIVV